MENIRNKETLTKIYEHVLPTLAQYINQNLMTIIPLFENFTLERVINTWAKDPDVYMPQEISINNGNVQQMGLKLHLEGFNKPGAETFDLTKDLLFKLETKNYSVGQEAENTWLEKNYTEQWEEADYEMIADRWSEELIDVITERLSG